MYVISKHRDFYDGVAGTTGIDKTIVYTREMIELDENRMPKIFTRKKDSWKRNDENHFFNLRYHRLKKEFAHVCDEHAYFIIGFCGKLYVGWKLYRVADDILRRVSTQITYDIDHMKTILEENSWYSKNHLDDIDYIQNFNAVQIFRDLNTPVFVYDSDFGRVSFHGNRYGNHKSKFLVNPILKDYEFFKVFDTFQAFQEIQMFLGGVLGKNEKEIIQVADKYKIAQHGFDKWSFRKMPEDGKRNK